MSAFQNGLTDWYLQRATTMFISAYALPCVVYWGLYPAAQLVMWQAFLTHPVMLVLGVLAWVALAIHAYIGAWVVITDYLSDHLARSAGGKKACAIKILRPVLVNLLRLAILVTTGFAIYLLLTWGSV